jgi:hypothetical protein
MLPAEYSEFLDSLMDDGINIQSGLGHTSDLGTVVDGFSGLLEAGTGPHGNLIEAHVRGHKKAEGADEHLARDLSVVYRALHWDRFPGESI